MQLPLDTTERLVAEVERYLGAVDTFRREGCEPHWRRERPPSPAGRGYAAVLRRRAAGGRGSRPR